MDENQFLLTIPRDLRTKLIKLNAHLIDNMPSYMVPAIYCPINAMPILTAGKIDRGRLSKIVENLAPDQISLYSLAKFQEAKVMPHTRMERVLQELWAKLLGMETSSIGIRDNFFRLGADSVVSEQFPI